MQKINFTKQFKQLSKSADKIIKEEALSFHANIVRIWAVAPFNSQDSRGKWIKPQRVPRGYKVVNTAPYAPILWIGRHNINGVTYGSEQMPQGGVPTLNNTINAIKNRMRIIK